MNIERWFLSSNAKDIGVLYLIFALFSGLLGTAFSVLIRLELAGPGVQYIADSQLYNSIITAHAILMIFFMVNFMQNLSLFSVTKGKNYHTNVEIGKGNNQKDPLDSKYDYTKVTVEDPYYNRDIIARVAKKKVYMYDQH
jgi:hypothetical protein